MRDQDNLPNLTLPSEGRGDRAMQLDLTFLLYKGGSKVSSREVQDKIATGALGMAIRKRISLVKGIHEFICGQIALGSSLYSIENFIRFVRALFQWGDENSRHLDSESIQNTYLEWTDYLIHRNRILKNLSPASAYVMGYTAGYVLDAVLDREVPLLSASRLQFSPKRKTARGVSAEKQSLAETFEFGHMVQDICDALTVDAVMEGDLPLRIRLRSGGEIVEWCGYRKRAAIKKYLDNGQVNNETGRKRMQLESRIGNFKKWKSEGTLHTRYPLVNRRIQAELLMFIAQTGMNFTQAHRLKIRHFYYASYIDGYEVRDRKDRRGGPVLFAIFREYKPHFERYLKWRMSLFPSSDELFPLIRRGGRTFEVAPQFCTLKKICNEQGIRFIPPQTLRNTRVNWILRRSGDPDLTAEMAQHSKSTLLEDYEWPSLQRAINEIARFWAKGDPATNRTMAVSPGQCDGNPIPPKEMPITAPQPDCLRASGCMWCEHHRDVDSFDYLWSLACFRHLKIIELSKSANPCGILKDHPVKQTIARISQKLGWFSESNAQRKEWIDEALARVEEGNYHPDWMRSISAMEGTL